MQLTFDVGSTPQRLEIWTLKQNDSMWKSMSSFLVNGLRCDMMQTNEDTSTLITTTSQRLLTDVYYCLF